jgi:hypothetical protein
MYDGIDSDAGLIPTDAQLVAGYVDGDYAWSSADWARFPHSVHVPIAVHSGTDAGIVLDVEAGDATPAESVGWVQTRRRAGADPTVYCSRSVWPSVRAAFQAAKVAEPHYWIADYDGDTAIPAGAVAHQYESGAHWDLSSVADYWPGVDPAATPAPEPDSEEEEMSTTSNAGRAGLSWPAGSRHIVQVTYDPAQGDPKLRVVLALTTGPWVAPQPWTLAKGNGTFEIPQQHRASCRGVILEGAATPVYDAVAV